VATDQDLANFQATSRIRTLQISRPYITHPDVAQLACARLRRAQSVPLARYSCKMNRAGFSLMQGDPVIATFPAYDVDGLVLRVQSIDYGSLEDSQISVDLVQDVFSVTAPTYSSPSAGGVNPDPTFTDSSGPGSTPSDLGTATWGTHFTP
jgi:hypothetical protein